MTRTAAFRTLGIPESSSDDTIRQAYLDLVKVWHPDRFAGDARVQAKASERLREINLAYELLSAPRPAPAPAARQDAGPPRAERAPAAPGLLDWAGLGHLPWRWLGVATVAILAAPFVLAGLRLLILGPAARDDQSAVVSRADGFGPSYLDEITIRHDGAGTEPAAGMRAESPGDLGQRIQGRWVAMRPADGRLAPGAGVEFRDGAVLSPDYPAVVGEYRPLSRSTLRVDDTTSGRTVVFEVWFPSPSAMTWRIAVDGVERGRIVFARA